MAENKVVKDTIAMIRKSGDLSAQTSKAKDVLVCTQTRLEAAVSAYNEANQADNITDAVSANADINNALELYNAVAELEFMLKSAATADPMLDAVKRLVYTGKAVRDKEDKLTGLMVRSIADKERYVNLYKLHQLCGGIGRTDKWIDYIDKFNYLMTAQKAVDLSISPTKVKNNYQMSKIAEAVDLGKNPTSKTNLLATLNTVIHTMIGDKYVATATDVNYLVMVYAKKGKRALSVACSNNTGLCNSIARICHRLVNNLSYTLDGFEA